MFDHMHIRKPFIVLVTFITLSMTGVLVYDTSAQSTAALPTQHKTIMVDGLDIFYRLRGCQPKKMLVSAAEAIDAIQRMDGKGVRPQGVTIDWLELMRFKRTDTDPTPACFEQSFADAGIEAFHGRARFVGSTSVAIGNDLLHGTHVPVATGAMPTVLPFPGAGRVPEIDALDLEIAGVTREPQGVTVNEYLQSMSNPAVYAAGDAAVSRPPLTPTAAHEGDVVAANLHGNILRFAPGPRSISTGRKMSGGHKNSIALGCWYCIVDRERSLRYDYYVFRRQLRHGRCDAVPSYHRFRKAPISGLGPFCADSSTGQPGSMKHVM